MTPWEQFVYAESKKLAEEAHTFTMLVRGAINCYEEGKIKDMMLESWQKVYEQSVRIRAFMDRGE